MHENEVQTKEQDHTLAAYMRDVARHDLLTPKREQVLSQQIVECRTRYFREVLSYLPYLDEAIALALTHVEHPSQMADEVRALQEAGVAARRTNRREPHELLEAATLALAKALAVADCECIGPDRIAADLESLCRGETRGLSMNVFSPRKGTQRFAQHVADVRRASAAWRCARNEFARANLRLVVKIAARFHRTHGTLHDRIQDGNVGLMKAIDRFDPSKGFRFSTYATWWIKHAIRRAVANRGRTIRVPAHVQTSASKMTKMRTTLRVSLEREPTVDELATAMEMALDKATLVLEAMSQRITSLDTPVGDEEGRTIADTLQADEERTPAEEIELARDTERVRALMGTLEPLERDIVAQRFGLDGDAPRTLAEIGSQYSLSRERIRQLQYRALARLREEFR